MSVAAGGPCGPVEPEGDDLREQPIGDLLKQLSQETTTLVRQELELAKAEMTVKAKEGGKGAGFLGGAGVAGPLAPRPPPATGTRPLRPRLKVLAGPPLPTP